MTAKRKTSTLDEPWRYGHVTTPVILAGTVFAVAAVLNATAVSPWYTLGVCMLATVLAPGVAVAFDSPRRAAWFVFFLFAAIASWLTWCGFTTPWQRAAVLSLIPGTLLFAAWWAAVARTTDREAHQAILDQRAADRAAQAGKWPTLCAQIGFKGITTDGSRTELPNSAGYSLALRFPPNGRVTYKILYESLGLLEVAAGRRVDSLRLEVGATAADAVLHVLERDMLAETLPYPIDRSPKSIHRPVPLGLYETGEVVEVTFREISALMVGLRGSGKSALANTHLAYLTGCTDAVVWMIDGKGGRTARPWIQPFLDEVTGRPSLDWVATTQLEADAMLLGARAAIARRSRGTGEKVIPSPSKPSIILIVEEASLITGVGNVGNSTRTKLAQETVVLGRSEAVDAILMAQRGTVTMLGNGDMKSQLGLRYGLGVSDQNDARSVFPTGKLAAELLKLGDDDRYRGTFLMQRPGMPRVLPAKGYWLEPKMIDGVAITNAQFRPDLDKETADAVHAELVAAEYEGGYYERWARYFRETGVSRGSAATVSPAESPEVSPAVSHMAPDGDTGQGTPNVPNPRGRTAAERLGLPPSKIVPSPYETAAAEPVSPAGGDTDLAEFDALISAVWDTAADEGDVPLAETGDHVPAILLIMARVFDVLHAERLHTARIIQELPEPKLTPKQLGQLMAHCNVAPVKEPFEVDGRRARGYDRASILRGIGSARSGARLNRAAYDWPDPA